MFALDTENHRIFMREVSTTQFWDYSDANFIFSMSDSMFTVKTTAVNCVLRGHATSCYVENDY